MRLAEVLSRSYSSLLGVSIVTCSSSDLICQLPVFQEVLCQVTFSLGAFPSRYFFHHQELLSLFDCNTLPWNPGTLEPWNPGTLEPWNPGTLEPWNPGTLEPWNPGTLEPWNPGTLEPWNPGTLEPWNPGFQAVL
ncbi:hypothetical protein ACJJIE_04590 [Microbulbifer sp. TRSA001]|uniref:hypothetical protein n=1 Tax=Microbulbifer sp. TRSA001 TaxID=3243381 RepID=UPI0040399487